MLRRVLPFLCVVAVMILIGCSGSADNTNTGSTNANHANTNRAAITTNAAPSNTATTNGTTAATSDKIGVAECDEFIAKYDACVTGKVPEAARAQFNASIKQWRDSWRTLAANPQTKGTLAQACKTSMESARTSMKSYGCEF